MKITIVLPFPGAGEKTGVWANSEREINFYTDHAAATRCTVSFAATELCRFLAPILEDTEIGYAEELPQEGLAIRLVFEREDVRGEDYSLIPEPFGLTIRGTGRAGVLYGAYELLKLQGYRWYEPGDDGTYTPPVQKALTLPKTRLDFSTPATVGRGISLDGQLNESEEIALFLARNRANVYFSRPNTYRLMNKLGFILNDGGHIFEAILNPNRPMPSGNTLYDDHPEWYGTPAVGEKSRERALATQFCVSCPDLLDFLGEELLRRTMDEWHEAEEINVWGFDRWGSVCTCPKCRSLGNSTDQHLHMASHFRDYLNRARAEGRLDRDVRMVLCAYEGTATLEPPSRPVPQNLIDGGDHILFAVIVRCYDHKFDDPTCSYNRLYDTALRGWAEVSPCLPIALLEYYNVSKFEDLPLLFTRTMGHDLSYYFNRTGAQGIVFMHIPMVNWGVRALTYYLFTELAWNPDADVAALVDEYLAKRYGRFAERMRRVYERIEDAAGDITSWRAWKHDSIIYKYMLWDGGIPKEPLPVDDHFGTPEGFEARGRAIRAALLEAKALLHGIIREAKDGEPPACRNEKNTMHALLDDYRNLIYGIDVQHLTLLLGCYYNALYRGDLAAGDALFAEIEAEAEHLESYYMPATYSQSELKLTSKDAFTRSQCDGIVARCRQKRKTLKG